MESRYKKNCPRLFAWGEIPAISVMDLNFRSFYDKVRLLMRLLLILYRKYPRNVGYQCTTTERKGRERKKTCRAPQIYWNKGFVDIVIVSQFEIVIVTF